MGHEVAVLWGCGTKVVFRGCMRTWGHGGMMTWGEGTQHEDAVLRGLRGFRDEFFRGCMGTWGYEEMGTQHRDLVPAPCPHTSLKQTRPKIMRCEYVSLQYDEKQ